MIYYAVLMNKTNFENDENVTIFKNMYSKISLLKPLENKTTAVKTRFCQSQMLIIVIIIIIIIIIIMIISLYLVITAPLISLLLGSTKGVLKADFCWFVQNIAECCKVPFVSRAQILSHTSARWRCSWPSINGCTCSI